MFYSHLRIETLRKKDYATAMRYGAEGMHFEWYAHGLGLKLYRWFFFHEMLNKATRAWGCYYRGYFQGALLACIEGETPLYRNPFMTALVRVVEWVIRKFDIAGQDDYDKANEEMLTAFEQRRAPQKPEAEILFLTANPRGRVKGVGTALVNQFERAAAGKLVYLYTDSGCTYPFYEHRGFSCEGERDVTVRQGKSSFVLHCYLYAKRL